MILLRHLPTAQEPRLYMALERTYLGYFKLIFFTIGTGLIAYRLQILFQALGDEHFAHLFHNLHRLLIWPPIGLIFVVGFWFFADLHHIGKGITVSEKEIIDPRIYMAAERTFLAWVRTGIGLIAFGFVIEKFDFFLEQLSAMLHTKLSAGEGFSGMGIIFIVLGVSNLVIGGINFVRTVKKVDQGQYHIHKWLYGLYGLILFTVTAVLAYMIVRVSP
ncbi:YidH family protein [Acidithiobacillus sp. IBUN Pt1247-S3]|uniref:YidH family protein n=1 Tax=Acidithiobacillus sp. IBUN Pt1247-S3 TaxID=3166642 RepID=UPI0034E54AAA